MMEEGKETQMERRRWRQRGGHWDKAAETEMRDEGEDKATDKTGRQGYRVSEKGRNGDKR